MIKLGVVPYADFGLFGPYGNRMLEKVKLTGARLMPDGTVRTIEINGPASYALWSASWQIYQNTLIMLDAVDLRKLVAY